MKVWFIAPDMLDRAAFEIVEGVGDIQGAVDASDKDLTGGPLLAVSDASVIPVLVLKEGSEQPQVFRPSPPAAAPVIQPPVESNPVDDHTPTDADLMPYLDAWLEQHYPDAEIEGTGSDGYVTKADKLAFISSQSSQG